MAAIPDFAAGNFLNIPINGYIWHLYLLLYRCYGELGIDYIQVIELKRHHFQMR
jgi:hypothetical protein